MVAVDHTFAAAGPITARAAPRGRVFLVMLAFMLIYGGIMARLIGLGVSTDHGLRIVAVPQTEITASRPDIIDRNGRIVATDIKLWSLFAEPKYITNVDEIIQKLKPILPDIDRPLMRKRLNGDRLFYWIQREITPKQRDEIFNLGLAGVGFLPESRRLYPGGTLASHMIGHTNVDNQGIAGLEKYIDSLGLSELHSVGFALDETLEPVSLSMDLRVQHALQDELMLAMEKYSALAAAGIVMNVNTGEVIALSSLPDYDSNQPTDALEKDRINRVTAGVFELGSTFKIFTTAMALDSGLVTLNSRFDATRPLRMRGFTINDFHAKRRVLSVPEVFKYSSNIGTAKMALTVGVEQHQEFIERIGLSKRVTTELPELGRPLNPRKWDKLTSVTVSYGHGISVSPLHAATAASALMNGGVLIPPTFFPRTAEAAAQTGVRVVSEETSRQMRYLMALNSREGSGRRARVEGYSVGGKTGTAEKVVDGKYVGNKRLNTFIATFPTHKPEYLVLITIDEPQREKPGLTATAGMNAAPTVGAVIRRAAPLLGLVPDFENADMILTQFQ
jgi:cell division protein FtsI (penicillin-binding protein 3)